MSNPVNEFVNVYNRLYEIMMGMCAEEHAPIYTAMAMREIVGFDTHYALDSQKDMKIATAQMDVFLEHGNFECDCPDNEVSPVCFACNVDAASKNIIQARAKLERQGLVSE